MWEILNSSSIKTETSMILLFLLWLSVWLRKRTTIKTMTWKLFEIFIPSNLNWHCLNAFLTDIGTTWPVKKAWRWYQKKLPTRKNCAISCRICFICFSTLKRHYIGYVTTRSSLDFRDVQGIAFCPGEPFISESPRFDHIFSKLLLFRFYQF